MTISDESPYPTEAELNAQDAQALWNIIHFINTTPLQREWMVGEQPDDFIIRMLERKCQHGYGIQQGPCPTCDAPK